MEINIFHVTQDGQGTGIGPASPDLVPPQQASFPPQPGPVEAGVMAAGDVASDGWQSSMEEPQLQHQSSKPNLAPINQPQRQQSAGEAMTDAHTRMEHSLPGE